MPPKASSHGRSLAQTAHLKQLKSTNATPDVQTLLNASLAKVHLLEEKNFRLEATLDTLSKQLAKCQDDYQSVKDLSAAQSEKCKNMYQLLWTERRARQRGLQRKIELEAQIDSLKSSILSLSTQLQNVIRNSSKTIDNLTKLEKENSQLLKNLDRATADAILIQKQLSQAGGKIQMHRKEAEKFKKRCDRAARVKAEAVRRGIARAKRDLGTHHLLSKGVYKENTRSLI